MAADTTIKDIASELNVSYATVSRALNDKEGVKAETRLRVMEVAKDLNYRPNAIARGLVNRKTHTLGLIIPDITNPFYPEVARGVEDAAQEQGYSVFLCNTNWERKKENHYLNLLAEKRVDGIIIAPVAKETPSLERLIGSLPCVYVGRSPREAGAEFITIDNERGGYLATEHLLKTGRAPVGFIGAPEDSNTLEERLRGYWKALAEYGEKIDERIILFGDFRRESGYNLVKKMMAERVRPRGVFGENDLLAIGALQGARELGLRIPGDLAVVGFDDIPIAGFPEIQLTTIGQPKYEMGRLAVEMLFDITGEKEMEAGKSRRIVLEPVLIIRGTA